MNFTFRTLAALCSVAVSLNTGCTGKNTASSSGDNLKSPLVTMGGSDTEDNVLSPMTALEDDYTVPEKADCNIVFDEENVDISGSGAYANGTSVSISSDGIYSLSGTSGDAKIIITADNVSLILDGIAIGSAKDSALEYRGKGKLLISLAEGSENKLSANGKTAVQCDGDLTINGSGSLYISGDTGISCDGELRLCGGKLSISADDDGITCGDFILISGADTTISSGGDGIRVREKENNGYFAIEKGSLDIKSSGDGIQTDNGIFVADGEISLSCGGGSSAVMLRSGEKYSYGRHGGYSTDGTKVFDFSNLVSGDGSKAGSKKGMRSGGVLKISGGKVVIDSADDSIFASGSIDISNGDILLSTGDDGIHSDRSVTVSGGRVEVKNSHSAIEGMSVDIKDGVLLLHSYRDGINASGGNDIDYSGNLNEVSLRYISISGGDTEIYSGGDGIDSNGTAAMSGGSLHIYAADNDKFGSICYSDSFTVSGGTLAAFGSDGMTKAPSMVSSPCISVFAKAEQGDIFKVVDDSGTVILNIIMPKRCDSAVLFSNDISEGRRYSIYANDTLLTEVNATGGICGDGPNGRDMGLFDHLINGSQSNSNTEIA